MPTIYYSARNKDQIIIPKKGVILMDRTELSKGFKFTPNEEIEKDLRTTDVPLEISKEELTSLIEFVKTKQKYDDLLSKCEKFIHPEKSVKTYTRIKEFNSPKDKAFYVMKKLIERGNEGDYLRAYDIMSKYHLSDMDYRDAGKLEEHVFVEFYCNLREIDKRKAYAMLLLMNESMKEAKYEAAYLRKLEQEKRITPKK